MIQYIKPCPECEFGTGDIVNKKSTFYIICHSCKFKSLVKKTLEDAISSWNILWMLNNGLLRIDDD